MGIQKTVSVTAMCAASVLLVVSLCRAECFEEAGKLYNVNPLILWSIAKNESNFNPAAVNWNKNGTYDYGYMQINSSWRKKIGEERWKLLGDACYNTKIGAWILAGCMQEYGNTWSAIGCYNARSKEKQKVYAQKIFNTVKIAQKQLARQM